LRESWGSLQKLPAHMVMVQGKEWEAINDCIWGDATAPFKFCGSTDTNVLLAHVRYGAREGGSLSNAVDFILRLFLYHFYIR
jgi:hypothetical protein